MKHREHRIPLILAFVTFAFFGLSLQAALAAGGTSCAKAGGFCATLGAYEAKFSVGGEADDCAITEDCYKVAGAVDAATKGAADAAVTAGASKKTYALSNPLGTSDFRVLAGRAIRIVTGVSGSVGLLMFIYGGFTWLTSGGSPEKIKKGKQIFVTAALGLIVIFGSYALLRALFAALSGFSNVTI